MKREEIVKSKIESTREKLKWCYKNKVECENIIPEFEYELNVWERELKLLQMSQNLENFKKFVNYIDKYSDSILSSEFELEEKIVIFNLLDNIIELLKEVKE